MFVYPPVIQEMPHRPSIKSTIVETKGTLDKLSKIGYSGCVEMTYI